jgi:hypothetical protein
MQRAAAEIINMSDLRRDRRHALPVLEVAIGDERFSSINWSMQGALLDGICDLIGTRVRGVMGVAGSREAIPFSATVIRADAETGVCAICFEHCRTEQVEFWPHHLADRIQ